MGPKRQDSCDEGERMKNSSFDVGNKIYRRCGSINFSEKGQVFNVKRPISEYRKSLFSSTPMAIASKPKSNELCRIGPTREGKAQ
jgi:hypothetical protein